MERCKSMIKLLHALITKFINFLIRFFKKLGWSTKDISDKWHTFGDLYHHRMLLTKIIAETYPEYATKSKLHSDGTMFEGSFIVTFTTTEGLYSYHYPLSDWGLFDIKEVERSPEYDGHRPEDIGRLVSLLEEKRVIDKQFLIMEDRSTEDLDGFESASKVDIIWAGQTKSLVFKIHNLGDRYVVSMQDKQEFINFIEENEIEQQFGSVAMPILFRNLDGVDFIPKLENGYTSDYHRIKALIIEEIEEVMYFSNVETGGYLLNA